MYRQKMNIHQLVGRLVRDPEVKQTQSGKMFMTFTLAYDTRATTDSEGSHANFLTVHAWENIASTAAPALKKGVQLLVNGELVQYRWQDQTGSKKSSFFLVAENIQVSDLRKKIVPEPEPAETAEAA